MPRVDEIGCRRPQMIPGRRHVLKSTLLSCILRSRAPRRHERDRGLILVERDDAHGVWVFRRCNGEHGAVLQEGVQQAGCVNSAAYGDGAMTPASSATERTS